MNSSTCRINSDQYNINTTPYQMNLSCQILDRTDCEWWSVYNCCHGLEAYSHTRIIVNGPSKTNHPTPPSVYMCTTVFAAHCVIFRWHRRFLFFFLFINYYRISNMFVCIISCVCFALLWYSLTNHNQVCPKIDQADFIRPTCFMIRTAKDYLGILNRTLNGNHKGAFWANTKIRTRLVLQALVWDEKALLVCVYVIFGRLQLVSL